MKPLQSAFILMLLSGFLHPSATAQPALKIDEPVAFSHEAGFYPEAFQLILSSPDPAATIMYTLDGSDPHPENIEPRVIPGHCRLRIVPQTRIH
jgi:hypothetical protein